MKVFIWGDGGEQKLLMPTPGQPDQGSHVSICRRGAWDLSIFNEYHRFEKCQLRDEEPAL
jgi:hypothetical protein